MPQYPRIFSFEFYPPKTPEGENVFNLARTELARLDPDFFSVTYGAGGSTRESTLATVLQMHADGFPVAPHISCIGSTHSGITEILNQYRKSNINHLVTLRGDLPSGTLGAGEFRYANELVEFIRSITGDYFHIEVAAFPEVHPQARSARDDLQNFKRKVEAGANAAITQYPFNADAYFHFIDDCESLGVRIPIVPGIMPIRNFSQLARFSERCGAEIPRWISLKMQSYGDDLASIRAFGLDVVTNLCERVLRSGAPGLHFYTLNRADLVIVIWQRLGLATQTS